MKKINLLWALSAAVLLFSCKKNDGPEVPPPYEPTQTIGYYVLNEGSIGGHNGTLGYYDVKTRTFTSDYFGQKNPDVELGDLPSDMVVYGSKAYVTSTFGNQVVVLNAWTGVVEKTLEVNGARSLAVDDGKVYVSSYRGEVVRIDTTTLTITGTAAVNGEYCEGIAVLKDKIYVANDAVKGGAQGQGNTVSVIDIATFTEEAQITTPTNPVGLVANGDYLYLTTSGEYDDSWNMVVDAQLHRIDPAQKKVVYTFPDVAANKMAVLDDYIYTVHFSYMTFTGSSRKINLSTNAVSDFLSEAPSMSVYNVCTNPMTDEIFIINSGYTGTSTIDSYDANGTLKYQMTDQAQGPYVSKVIPVNI